MLDLFALWTDRAQYEARSLLLLDPSFLSFYFSADRQPGTRTHTHTHLHFHIHAVQTPTQLLSLESPWIRIFGRSEKGKASVKESRFLTIVLLSIYRHLFFVSL